MRQMSFYDEPVVTSNSQTLYAVDDHTTAPVAKNQVKTGNVTEIIVSPEQAENMQMLLPMMTQLNQDNRWLAWIDPPQSLLNRWQQQSGIITNQIMILRSSDTKTALELTQQALSAGTCHAVVTWTSQLTKRDFNLLEAASAKGDSHGVVMRYR
ncbi:cell division inhibitor SulA [Alkalimarinus sediminis]|uniref:SulA-like leucine-rich domain-containing protein n=1 Tax=Alkalimarinus sediminis TaxID=1632866 RepID=A0A9E8HQ11_9ALTE|nr:SulA-like leucine-rich domain-containing protein [Alkalimarinus sediminis]UZW76623.1 SulA-like leucine-rich domain-containing protein [Alkalimarinus sediminis]